MKYCSHCGEQVNDDAVVCVKCGCSVASSNNKILEDPNESTIGYAVLGYFVPLAGLILFLLWNETYPKRAKSAGKGALISVIVNTVISIISIIIYVIVIATVVNGKVII